MGDFGKLTDEVKVITKYFNRVVMRKFLAGLSVNLVFIFR